MSFQTLCRYCTMKLMISGSRTATNADYIVFERELKALNFTELLHGGANGFDQFANAYASENGRIPTTTIRPDYTSGNAKYAPLLRIQTLVDMSDFVICFYALPYPQRSAGTYDTAKRAAKAGKLLKEVWTRGGGELSLF